jgi:protein SFI1
MSQFKPARSSPPLRPSLRNPTITAAEEILGNSRSSIASTPELAALSSEEIEFIDTVISKAGPSATTFLTIFKAYNDTLQERGLDPQHEVVYYGKLLKLGTLKGKNWGEKWETVKGQQSHAASKMRAKETPLPTQSQPPARPPPPPNDRIKVLTRLTGALKAIEKEDDVFTLHSHQDDSESEAKSVPEPDPEATPVPRHRARSVTSRRPPSPTLTSVTDSVVSRPDVLSSTKVGTPAYRARQLLSRATAPAWDAETSEATVDTARGSSSVPPSYNAATRESNGGGKSSYKPLRALAQAHTQASSAASQASTSHIAPAAARAAILQARERKGTVLNEDDAWNKIKMARDEEEADRFREDKLQERCWEVWKQGYQWIVVCQYCLPIIFESINNFLLLTSDYQRANFSSEGQSPRSPCASQLADQNS